jgi:hypothetical protein
VDELLLRLGGAGFGGVPRPLGYDDRGRQILTFIEGEVPGGEGPYRLSDARIRSAAALIRAFHDAIGRQRSRARYCRAWRGGGPAVVPRTQALRAAADAAGAGEIPRAR